jgi:hypothetical protein
MKSRCALWIELVALGCSFYFLTSLLIVAGISLGGDYLGKARSYRVDRTSKPFSTWDRVRTSKPFANWDGVWYAKIARDGYSYDPGKQSSVAFFPAFPLLGWVVAHSTGISEEWALVLVANACLLCCFIWMAAYVHERYPDGNANLVAWTLLGLGLWPVSFFARMAYSESLFLLVVVLVLYGFQRKWPMLAIAFLVGLATACRPLGVALIPPFCLYLWQERSSWNLFALRAPVAVLVACWGIVAYMAYQQAAFHDALAFVKTQKLWDLNPHSTWVERLGASLILEPIWSKYISTSPAWWARSEHVINSLFSLDFANPIYFLVTLGLVGYGAWHRQLNSREALLALGLLLIPYFLQGHRAFMVAQGRYALAALPAFLVVGRILWRLPSPFSAALLAISGFFLAVYSALFTAWYWFI